MRHIIVAAIIAGLFLSSVSFGTFASVPGRIGNALSFDGANDYVTVTDYNGISGANPRTVSAWFKTSTAAWSDGSTLPYNMPLVQWGHDSTGELWMVYLKSDRKAAVGTYGGGVYSSVALNDGQWHNIVAVLPDGQNESNQIQLYVDGQLNSTVVSYAVINTNTADMPVHIGAWKMTDGSISNYCQGLIDDVRIYNRALTAGEIVPAALPQTGLVTHWTMDETTGLTAHDSVSSYNGLLTGVIYNGSMTNAITIGTWTATWNYPLYTGSHDARTQTIYLASEIGGAKIFEALSLNIQTIPGQVMNNFTIRLRHSNLSSYTSSSVWGTSNWVTVYQANRTILATGWVVFPFTTQFEYNGTQNLMVDISFNNASSSSSGYCYSSVTGANRSLSYNTNSSYGDPLTWSDRTPTPQLSTRFPNIRLGCYVEAQVPDVVGITQTAAESAITSANLVVATVTTAYDSSIAAGNVISQSPSGGTLVNEGSAVNLVVSRGPAVTVPDVVGMIQADAESAITSAGLSVGTVTTTYDNSIPAGHVISQMPVSGTLVDSGSAVNLVVSLGLRVAVPDVLEILQADAESAIISAGLSVGTVTTTYDNSIPAGHVISQMPVSGTLVDPGSVVNLVVSLGLPVVPDVIGMTQTAAESAITSVNLVVGTVTPAYDSSIPAGIVISQSPSGGVLVDVNSAVDLVISLGPAVTVPDVVGMLQANAESALVSVGLVVGTVTNAYDISVPAGHIISQTPVTGAIVSSGSAVNLVVSLGMPLHYGGGSGTSDDPYQISSVASWQALMSTPADWDKHFILIADIDLQGIAVTPVGNSTYFSGIFDGNDHVIQNVVINTPADNNVGLFGNFAGEIINLGLISVDIHGNRYVGGLIGNNQGSITSCYVTGNVRGNIVAGGLVGDNWGWITSCYVTGNVSGGSYIGGLVGKHAWGDIQGCYATGVVSGDNTVGGLTGRNAGWLISCYAMGNVNGTGHYIGGLAGSNTEEAYVKSGILSCFAMSHVLGNNYVGGLVGENTSSITSCCAMGNVSGSSSVGGLVGYNSSTTDVDLTAVITFCYATGNTSGGSYVGGLVGDSSGYMGDTPSLWNYSYIIKSYSEGAVSGSSSVGGLVGNSTVSSITSSFWDADTSGRITSAGGMGKTTAEMMTLSTFTSAGWDFSTTDGDTADWMMLRPSEDYPRLAWQDIILGDIAGLYGVDIADLEELASHWLASGCPMGCEDADIDDSGIVELPDFKLLTEHWLEGI